MYFNRRNFRERNFHEFFANLTLFHESFSREKIEIVHSRKFISQDFIIARKVTINLRILRFFLTEKSLFAKVYLAKMCRFLHSRKFIQNISRILFLAKVSPIKVVI